MTPTPRFKIALLAFVLLALLLAPASQAGRRRSGTGHEGMGHLTFTSPQSNPIALSPDGGFLYVANTTSNTLEVIDATLNRRVKQIDVGLEPVSVAVRPDGKEVWVANHVSDSVSVIDTDPASASYRQVVETIQDLRSDGATLFDEPVGIAFADHTKAYVALSSRNQVAIVDAASYSVSGLLNIRAQEPRAIAVRNGRLYVAAFESGNRSELSACGFGGSAPQCTLFVTDLANFAMNPNLPGFDKNIVIDPQVPDRDLFVFNTSNDNEIKVVEGVGTLLYGLAVDASDRVYVTQTDARNAVNGITSGPGGDVNGDGDVNLADLENRMFTNEVAILNCGVGGSSCSVVSTVDLDPGFPNPTTALATPYGIVLSDDDSTLVATAAGTSRLFTMNSSGAILAQLDVGAIPRGVALRSEPGTGAPQTAYVLNTLDNSVMVVDVSNPGSLDPSKILKTLFVGADPTPEAVRLGRIAFNDAFASTSGSFACASCHPDGHTDQLLWRIGGKCSPTIGCVADEDEARSTMPIKGLRDSLPLHWDGTLGDPFGGPNGATGSGGNPGSNCSADPHTCFRHLVDESLAGVMCDQTGPCPPGGTLLSEQEKDDMSTFLERVSYPPARSRRIDDSLSRIGDGITIADPDGNNPIQVGALEGFQDFFIDQNGSANPTNTCADSNGGCHELPLGTATNSETLEAFDAPTMRGMTDRFLQFSLGPAHTEELLTFANSGFPSFGISPLEAPIQWDINQGFREITTFGAAFAVFEPIYGVRPLDIFQMFEEASTGPSGALGRQVTLNSRTTGPAMLAEMEALLAELEAADARGVVNLRGSGLRGGKIVKLSYLQDTDQYKVGSAKLTRAQLIAEAQTPTLLATLTAHLRSGVSEHSPQPLVAPVGAQCDTGPNDPDPLLPPGSSFQFEGAHVADGDAVFLNGQDTGLTVSVLGGSSSCSPTEGQITTQLLTVSGLTRTGGTDLLQIRSANGLLSNEMPLAP